MIFVHASKSGPNLYDDLVNFKSKGLTHLETPPYWTKNKNGKRGKLKQKCTGYYKIAVIRRAIREYLFTKLGISKKTKRLPMVETWIGFAADEQHRVKESRKTDPKFVRLCYPLIDLGMTKAKISGYYLKNNIEKPPRSVCCACFSNGLDYFEKMYKERPTDWAKAVAVDNSIKDMTQLGVNEECYVSSSLVPLQDLPAKDFLKNNELQYEIHKCNTGMCFI